MKEFRWSEDKNILLKEERGVSFEEILDSKFIGAERHPTRKNQMVLKFEGLRGSEWVQSS